MRFPALQGDALRPTARVRIPQDESGTFGQGAFLREPDLRSLGFQEQALGPECHAAVRARLLRLVLVDQSFGPQVAGATLQVHVAGQDRGALSGQVGVVGLDVHRLRLSRVRVEQ